MALLSDDLSVWDIGFRWAGLDPTRWWLQIPLEVKDTFRNLMDAILKAELACSSISLEKPEYNPDLPPECSVYRHLDDMHACIWGQRYNRKLLRWASIERHGFHFWCEHRGIPLPEFWFPPGWNLEYELSEDELLPGHHYMRRHWRLDQGVEASKETTAIEDQKEDQQDLSTEEFSRAGTAEVMPGNPSAQAAQTASAVSGKVDEIKEKLRANQTARLACQQIAFAIWKEDSTRTIASVTKDELILKYGGGAHYNADTLREWVKVVAPDAVRAKRGRPPKKKGSLDE